MQLLKATAAASGKLPPDTAPVDDGQDRNYDSSLGWTVMQGTKCHVDTRNKFVVLGNDGARVLVELRNRPCSGPELIDDLIDPVISNGTLDFQPDPGRAHPACLNKMKLWVDRDVFVALQALDVPPDPRAVAKQKNAENKSAVQRALPK